MDGPGNYHTKGSKSDREREIWYCLYMEYKEKWYNVAYLQNKKRLIDLENTPGGGVGGMDSLGGWDSHTHSTLYKIGNQQRPIV